MIIEPIIFEIEVKIPYENYTNSKLIRKITLSSGRIIFEAINNNNKIFFISTDDEHFSPEDKKEIRTYKECNYEKDDFEEWKIKYIKSSEKIVGDGNIIK